MQSTLYIVDDIDTFLQQLLQQLPIHNTRVIRNEDETKQEFLIQHAHKAINEAYITEENTKYILLCGNNFRLEAQNALLKILEEPPKNILFMLITTTKNSILPTILSRVNLQYNKTPKQYQEFELNLACLDMQSIYNYLKQHQKITKQEAKDILESILYTTYKNNIYLSNNALQSFGNMMKLIELNSNPTNIILSTLLLFIETINQTAQT